MTQTSLTSMADIRAYLFGCRHSATFTIVSKKTNSHFTFCMRREPKKQNFFFVDGLVGSDNTKDYSFLGTIRRNYDFPGWTFNWSPKSPVADDAPLIVAIDFFIARLNYDRDLNLAKIEFWYSGRRSQCGRVLTVPESLARGMGPKCRAKAGELLK